MKKLLILFLLLPLCGCGKKNSSQKNSVRPVKTVTAQQSNADVTRVLTGKVKEQFSANLAFRVAGTIIDVPVREGEYVKKGDLLALIDRRDYRLQLEAAKVQYEQIKAEVARVKKLHASQGVTDNDYDKAVAGEKLARAEYERAKNEFADTRLTAPYNGYISTVFIDEHETIDAGIPAVAIINTSKLEIEADLPLNIFQHKEGIVKVECYPETDNTLMQELELAEIVPAANMNQLYRARFSFAEQTPALFTPGMTVRLNITYKESAHVSHISLPLETVFNDNSTSYVWVVHKDMTVSRRPVSIKSVYRSGKVIVEKGVEAGETIVSAGIHSLKEGQRVRFIPKPSKTNAGGLL